jgi:hypothetical protein
MIGHMGRWGRWGRCGRWASLVALSSLTTAFSLLPAGAQQNPNATANFVKVTAPVIALTHVRVIDGTGAPVLTPQLQDNFHRAQERLARNTDSVYVKLFPKGMALERAFAKSGGVLLAGTDPTGAGGVIPGYSNQRQLELLVEEGFTPLEAIAIGTLNAAKYLGREARIGSIAAGKQADLVVVAGDPSKTIADVRRVETVFKQGVGFDPIKLVDSVKGQAGIW